MENILNLFRMELTRIWSGGLKKDRDGSNLSSLKCLFSGESMENNTN